MRRFYLLLAVAMVAVVSCQREYHWEETELLLDSGNSPRIVGGEEINPSLPPNVLNVTDSLPNPYAISNMRLAYQNAISKYGESVFGSFDINDIVLTHSLLC